MSPHDSKLGSDARKPKPLPFLDVDDRLERAFAQVAKKDVWATPSSLISPEQLASWATGEYSVSAADVVVDGDAIGGFRARNALYASAAGRAASNYHGDFAELVQGGSSQANQIVVRFLAKAGIHSVALGRNLHHSMLDALTYDRIGFCFLGSTGYLHRFEALLPPTALQVAGTLKAHRDTQAVLITSPTYEGLVADIAGIAEVIRVHDKNCLLIIDAAWAAHHPFSSAMPATPLQLGADLMVTSCHKCGGGLQSSALIVARLREDGLTQDHVDLIAASYDSIASTSPTPLILTSIDVSQQELALRGEEHIGRLCNTTEHVRERVADEISGVEIMRVADSTKVTLSLAELDLSGFDLSKRLIAREIVPEKAGMHSITFLCTFQMRDGAADRLANALKAELSKVGARRQPLVGGNPFEHLSDAPDIPPWITTTLSHAKSVPLSEAANRVPAQRLELYPPGIPLVVPGFRISQATVNSLLAAVAAQASLATAGPFKGAINVIDDEIVKTYDLDRMSA